MKAIAVSGFIEKYSDLRVSEVPSPSPHSPDQILVDITHAGINHVDLLYARGKHQNNHNGLISPPFILGLEFAGLVAAAPSSSAFRAGDRVWGSGVGAFAEQIAVKENALQRVPESWSLQDVAGLGAATVPVSYGALLHVAKVQEGETVIATVGSMEKASVVSNLDVDAVVRYDVPQWEKQVLKATGGEGVDVVLDTVGLVEKSLRCLKYGGRIVVAGFAGLGGNMEKLAMNRILLKGAVVLGYRYGESGRRNASENAAIWHGLNAMLERAEIKPIIYATYRGLESVPRALEDLAARKVWGKAIIHTAFQQVLQSRI